MLFLKDCTSITRVFTNSMNEKLHVSTFSHTLNVPFPRTAFTSLIHFLWHTEANTDQRHLTRLFLTSPWSLDLSQWISSARDLMQVNWKVMTHQVAIDKWEQLSTHPLSQLTCQEFCTSKRWRRKFFKFQRLLVNNFTERLNFNQSQKFHSV